MLKLSLLGQVEVDFDFDASSDAFSSSQYSDFVDCSDVIPESKLIKSSNKRRARARGMMSWSKGSKDDSDDGDDFQDYPTLPAGKTMEDIEQAVSYFNSFSLSHGRLVDRRECTISVQSLPSLFYQPDLVPLFLLLQSRPDSPRTVDDAIHRSGPCNYVVAPFIIDRTELEPSAFRINPKLSYNPVKFSFNELSQVGNISLASADYFSYG